MDRKLSRFAIVALMAGSLAHAQILVPILGGGVQPIKLVTFGDSITANPPQGNCSPVPTEAGSYSVVLKGLIAARQGKPVTLTQVGESGSSWTYTQGTGNPSLATYLATGGNLVTAAAGPNTKLVLFAGTNGLVLGGNTPAQEYAAFQGVLATLLTQGYAVGNIAVITMLPRQSYSEVNREAYNTLLEGGAVTSGYNIVNLDVNFDISYPNQQGSALWFCPDLIHPTTTDPQSTGGAHTQIAYHAYDSLYPGFPWTPVNAYSASILRWYDATVSSSITQSGGSVSGWNDLSGHGENLTQSTGAAKPGYSATAINGHPALTFNAAPQYLSVTGLSDTGNNVSCWSVFQLAVAPGPNNNFIFDTQKTGQSGFGTGFGTWNNSGSLIADDFNDSLGPNRTLADENAHSVISLAAVSSAIRQGNLFLDGSFPADTSFPATNASATTLSPFTVQGFQVGAAWHLEANFPWNGNIGEIGCYYTSRLSAYDQLKLYSYMKAKWGTP